jgi:hypothetical protein
MKTVQSAKNSLKFKAPEKEGILSVRVGVRKYSVPVKARMLSDGEYMFLSFPASSELYRIDGKQLKPLAKDDGADEAFEALTPSKRRGGGRRRRRREEVPPQLAEALRAIPAGYKLGYDAEGNPKLVKKRTRRGKNEE